MALNMLREAMLDAESPGESYDVRLIRRVRIQAVRAGMQYWTPAVYSAAIAALALVAGLQLLGRSGELPTFSPGATDARRIQVSAPDFPTLPLHDRILIDR